MACKKAIIQKKEIGGNSLRQIDTISEQFGTVAEIRNFFQLSCNVASGDVLKKSVNFIPPSPIIKIFAFGYFLLNNEKHCLRIFEPHFTSIATILSPCEMKNLLLPNLPSNRKCGIHW